MSAVIYGREKLMGLSDACCDAIPLLRREYAEVTAQRSWPERNAANESFEEILLVSISSTWFVSEVPGREGFWPVAALPVGWPCEAGIAAISGGRAMTELYETHCIFIPAFASHLRPIGKAARGGDTHHVACFSQH